MGTPSGGARDEQPPRFMHSNPAPGQTNFSGSELALTFDELVNVKDPFTKVTVSPPNAGNPKIFSSGRKIYVQFPDTLHSNTTYTIDFGRSIEDNNEGNPLGNLALSFSTGPDLDSLRISGVVLDAYTLEPQQGMLVGAYRASDADTLLATTPFEHITKTDDRGRFTLRGLKSVDYMLYALGDLNNDYKRDNPAELLGFYPLPIKPYAVAGTTHDSIYDMINGRVDSVVERGITRFLPNDILISVFDEGYRPQYISKYSRPDSAKIELIFNARLSQFPSLRFTDMDAPAYRLEYSANRTLAAPDTLTYWLLDERFTRRDTLMAEVKFDQSCDTLRLTRPKIKSVVKKHRTAREIAADSIAAAKARLLGVTITPAGSLNIYDSPLISFSEPVENIDTLGLHLLMKVDTTWVEQPRPTLEADSASAMRNWRVRFQPTFGQSYRLELDSMAAISLYDKHNASARQDFMAKRREDYAQLILRISPDTIPGFVEVLNVSDAVVAREQVKNGVVSFRYLAPADYYARFVADTDSNQVFTPGNYELRRQPEETWYYPGMLSLKRHDRSEHWNLNSTPVDAQKPAKLLKNKPESTKRRRQAEEEPAATTPEDEEF